MMSRKVEKRTIGGTTYHVQMPSAMWLMEQQDEFLENPSPASAKRLLNTLLENTITKPANLTVDSFELPKDETVSIGGLEFVLHHPGVPWHVWSASQFVTASRQLRRAAFLKAAVEAGAIGGASPDDLTSLVDLGELVQRFNSFLDQAEAWQLYYQLFFRPADAEA